MWCLVYIAMSTTSVPPTDCSITSLDVCTYLAVVINQANWDDDLEKIPYLAKCMSTEDKDRQLMVEQVNRALAVK